MALEHWIWYKGTCASMVEGVCNYYIEGGSCMGTAQSFSSPETESSLAAPPHIKPQHRPLHQRRIKLLSGHGTVSGHAF
jgi:hypothetical protein